MILMSINLIKKIMIDITMIKLMKKKIILIKLLNTDETFIVVILLLWTKIIFLCCNFTIYGSWTDRECNNTLKNNYMMDMLSNTVGITDGLNLSESSR
jgi:hypothetical protein